MLGWLPEVAVEVALAPHAAGRRYEQQLAVLAVEIDLGFDHPGEGRRDRDRPPRVVLAVVGLGAVEDRARGQARALHEMRPERIELSTSGLKDRRSLGLVKTPLTTELRALTHPCVS